MGLQQSKIIQQSNITSTKSISRSKSLNSKQPSIQKQLVNFKSHLTSIASLNTISSSTIQKDVFNRLPFKSKKKHLPMCNCITNNYDSIFICYDCSKNDRAYLCQKCFQKGNHDSHNFCLFQNNNGSNQRFCRCGDSQFMLDNTTCQDHKNHPKMSNKIILDKIQQQKFNSYFIETFKVLYNLMNIKRGNTLNAAIFQYFQNLTNDSLYYSKMVAQFLLLPNPMNNLQTNLHKFILQKRGFNQVQYKVFRNIAFLGAQKKPLVNDLIRTLNTVQSSCQMHEFIINFLGNIELLNQFAKQQDLVYGIGFSNLKDFYYQVIKTQSNASQIWKCFARNKMMKNLVQDENIFSAILTNLSEDKNSLVLILNQLLEEGLKSQPKFIVNLLMAVSPDFFQMKNKKVTNLDKNTQDLLKNYYIQIFKRLQTRRRNDQSYPQMILLLPFFTFGEELLNIMWDQMDRRIVLSDNKKAQRWQTQEQCWNFLTFFNNLTKQFVTWQHKNIARANRLKFKKFFENQSMLKKLVEQRLSSQKQSSYQYIKTYQLINIIDTYTLNTREIMKNLVKKQLKYSAQHANYSYIGAIIANNLYNYQKLEVSQKFNISIWHEFVGNKVFSTKVFFIIKSLIKTLIKICNNDIDMVKTASNICIVLCLLNKKQQENLKESTQELIRQINETSISRKNDMDIIRSRFDIQIQQMNESGKKGRKKIKGNFEDQELNKQENIMKPKKTKSKNMEKCCYICLQKQEQNNRLVFPCYFTRNNVVSTLLDSTVTDIDMNICPHQIHELCYEKLGKSNTNVFSSNNQKKQCPVCFFQMNCFIPLKPLPDQTFNKNWLRNFQQIITQFNLKTGRCSSTDWATIFLTFLVFSRGCKILMNSTQKQIQQRNIIDQLIIGLFKYQMQKFPDQTRKVLDKAYKTMKGQVARQSPAKKAPKSFTLQWIMEEILGNHIKNQAKLIKKLPELIQAVGKGNASKIIQSCEWSRNHQQVKKVYDETPGDLQPRNFFEIRKLPKDPSEFLKTTSIKCPMCNKYDPSTKQCLFCEKRFCSNCINPNTHCQNEHKGNTIYLHLNDAQYEFYFSFSSKKRQCLYWNQYYEGWRRSMKTSGWKSGTKQIYEFFDRILHTENPFPKGEKNKNILDDSDEQ